MSKTGTVRTKKIGRSKLRPIALNTSDGAKYVGLSESMMRKMRSMDDGPRFRKIGKKVVYLRKDLQKWLESK